MKPLPLAIQAAKQAGLLLKKNFKKHHTIKVKDPHEIVSEMDARAERKIISLIKKHFPSHSILSEEAGETKKQSEYEWVIDPLDGTTNYTVRNPFFDVSIALLKNNQPLVGVVYAPMTADLFSAEKGRGAFLNGKRINVSTKTNLKKALVVFCHGNTPADIKRITKIFSVVKPKVRDFNRMRAGALELALVAVGHLEAYVSPGTHLWDVAAGMLLIQEAGGKVTNFQNKTFQTKDYNFIASNGKIHNKLLRFIK